MGHIDLRYAALEIEKSAQSRLSCPMPVEVMNEASKYIVILWKPHSSTISSGNGHDKQLWAHFSISRATYLRSMWPKKGLNWLILVCRLKVALTLMEVKRNKNEGTFWKKWIFLFV